MKTVLVLGPARSGTSLLSGLLHQLGVNMNPVDNPSYQNPKGSFEDAEFIHLTIAMKMDLNAGLNEAKMKAKFNPKIKEIVKKRKDALWGFKSALTNYALPYLLPYLRNPHIVVNHRSPLDNAESWVLHKKLNYGETVSLEQAIKVVAEENLKIINAVNEAKVPTFFTSYERIKKEPLEEAKKIAEFLGVDIKNNLPAVKEFVDPNYSTLKISLEESGLPKRFNG